MSYPPPQDQDESRGGVPYSYGTVPDWGSPPSSQYNIPSNSGGAPPDRESGHDRTLALHQQYLQQVDQSQYDTATAAQTQYRGFLYQDRQQDYRQQTPQQQQYSPQYSQQQQYSSQYSQQQRYPPYHERSHTNPICHFPDCHQPARRGLSTNGLVEYCGEEHMRQDVRRGVPLCPSCKKSPRRLDSEFCGPGCAYWAEQIQQQSAGSGPSYSRRVEEVKSHKIITESGTYGGANNNYYQSGGYPKAESLASEPVTSVGGGGGSGGGSSVNVNFYNKEVSK